MMAFPMPSVTLSFGFVSEVWICSISSDSRGEFTPGARPWALWLCCGGRAAGSGWAWTHDLWQ